MDVPRLHAHGDYLVVIKRLPDAQFGTGGFGWSFGIVREDPEASPLGLVVIRSALAPSNEDEILSVRAKGLQIATAIIDNQEVNARPYECYSWSRFSGLAPANCDELSPNTVRTPLAPP